MNNTRVVVCACTFNAELQSAKNNIAENMLRAFFTVLSNLPVFVLIVQVPSLSVQGWLQSHAIYSFLP